MLGFKKFFEERTKAKEAEQAEKEKSAETSHDLKQQDLPVNEGADSAATDTRSATELADNPVEHGAAQQLGSNAPPPDQQPLTRAEKKAVAEAEAEAKREARRQRREQKAQQREAEIQARQSVRDDEKSERRSQREAAREKARLEREFNPGLFTRVKKGLSRTSANFAESFAKLLLGQQAIDDDLMEEIETQLLVADVGIAATNSIIENLTHRVKRKQLADSGALYGALQEALQEILEPCDEPLMIDELKKPYVILVVGVNGVGKTTTIAKMTKRLQDDDKTVLLAAGDTFRAAAVEQLQVWGERNSVPVVAQHTGADSASVIFDAMQAAKARGIDVVIADTAGRLHNKANLMEELAKVTRVMKKIDESAPHEVMLVLDAGTGQNALSQAEIFQQAVGVTGITLTKLDGTAKGGMIFAVCQQFKLPIRFIGVGEQVEDLRPFNAEEFVQALFALEEDNATTQTEGKGGKDAAS